jgi:hypothetical protein
MVLILGNASRAAIRVNLDVGQFCWSAAHYESQNWLVTYLDGGSIYGLECWSLQKISLLYTSEDDAPVEVFKAPSISILRQAVTI